MGGDEYGIGCRGACGIAGGADRAYLKSQNIVISRESMRMHPKYCIVYITELFLEQRSRQQLLLHHLYQCHSMIVEALDWTSCPTLGCVFPCLLSKQEREDPSKACRLMSGLEGLLGRCDCDSGSRTGVLVRDDQWRSWYARLPCCSHGACLSKRYLQSRQSASISISIINHVNGTTYVRKSPRVEEVPHSSLQKTERRLTRDPRSIQIVCRACI